MSYVLSDLQDGKRPAFRHVPDDYKPQASEQIVSDVDFDSRRGWVWDVAGRQLRQPTAEEQAAQRRPVSPMEERLEAIERRLAALER